VAGHSRLVRTAALGTAIVLILEICIICAQAARGTTSHFNNRTPLDSMLFGLMGLAILVLWLLSVLAAVLLWRQPFDNRAWGWGLRYGLLLTAAGGAVGAIMVAPDFRAHTVGAPDGGPGLPVTNWSLRHGDLRVGHFVGMHALQILPFVGWYVSRRRRSALTVHIAAVSLAGLMALTTARALQGRPVWFPDPLLGGWALASAIALLASWPRAWTRMPNSSSPWPISRPPAAG
jgi:hypothetical protein